MLDNTTKRRIDTARDILVGKIPDPKSQVEQITIALIYKFMDDMDAEAEELGGERKFFANGFAKYGWNKLLNSGLGGHDMLDLYTEAITRMPENPGIPLLFRNIFKNAYLPYRDPETLRSFLKIINEFSYDHSERLGDAFEYLLSVLGSQGSAGQFRTPRHIIDFIVEIVEPKKDEVILDPACGTAGFLISSYKHILKSNLDEDGYSTLTPDDKGRMVENFKGYDISPDMVRLSLVNMYLHGFSDPHIFEYDTLTSQERWNEYADVILANPPFMSPKGGIKPHNRFSVQSKRSEVLFVDYIAEHLTPEGRAGVIVPEGIIFQSQNAYKQLRKKLIEESLVAVISLPAGVFQPYSGVKTSILIMDKALARKADTIAFFKVENDGYGLGAQRRPIDKNDLPEVLDEARKYLDYIRAGDNSQEYLTNKGLVVKREKIAENGEYNLSGERYRVTIINSTSYPLKDFKYVITLEYGFSLPKPKRIKGPFPVMGSNGIVGYHNEFKVEGPAIIVGRKGTAGQVTYIEENCFPIDTTYYIKQVNSNDSDLKYLYRVLKALDLKELRDGAGIPGLNREDVYNKFKIPLPPLEIQKEIVAEIESYQKIIDGARAVVENYRPHIPIDPNWPMIEVRKVAQINPKASQAMSIDKERLVSFVPMADLSQGNMCFEAKENRHIYELNNSYTYFEENDVLIAKVTPCFENGKAGLARNLLNGIGFGSSEFVVIRVGDQVLPEWLYIFITSPHFKAIAIPQMTGTGGLQRVPRSVFENYLIPLPPIEAQREIIEAIEAEQAMVNANYELIERFEKKIEATINRIWGES